MADGSHGTTLSFPTHPDAHIQKYENRQGVTHTALTGVLPEETLGAPKVLPGECGVPLKIIYKNFIQGLWPVNTVHYVGVWGGARRGNGKRREKDRDG